MRLLGKLCVDLRSCACLGVDFFQLRDRKGRFFGILARIIGVKVAKLGALRLHLRNDQTHLQTPVAEMNVADDMVSEEAIDALDGFSDDGAAQVSDMQRLCHVRSAIVHDNRAGILLGLDAEVLVKVHFCDIRCQKLCRELEVQKAGVYRLDAFKHLAACQLLFDRICNLDGRLVVDLRRGQRAVALIFAQVRAVRERDFSVGGVEAGFFERAGNLPGNQINQDIHIHTPFVLAIAHRFYYYNKACSKSTVRNRRFRSKRTSL